MKRLIAVGCGVVLVLTVCAVLALASPAVGVTPTLIGRATYEPFKVKTGPQSLVEFDAKAKSHVDIVVRTHDYAAGGSTGWHTIQAPSSSMCCRARSRSMRPMTPRARRMSCPLVRVTSTRGADTWAATKRASPQRMSRLSSRR